MQATSPNIGQRTLRSLVIAAAVGLAAPGWAQTEPRQSSDMPGAEVVGNELAGAFFLYPEGKGPFPAIIILGGSEGGDSAARQKAPLFLEQGYAVLGLPYYSPAWFGRDAQFPELPKAFHNIPIDRLETALTWLRAQPTVAAEKIGLYGVSKGAEFALAGASRIDGFAAVVAIVPSDVIWEGWGPGTIVGQSSGFSWRGAALPFVPYLGMDGEFAKYRKPGERPRLRTPQDAGRHSHPERVAAAIINVENIDEPVFIAGGDLDNTWASGEMTQQIAERRAAAGLTTVSLIFLEAGHALSGTGEQNTQGTYRYSEADLAAQVTLWPATLAFMTEHVKRERGISYPVGTVIVRERLERDGS